MKTPGGVGRRRGNEDIPKLDKQEHDWMWKVRQREETKIIPGLHFSLAEHLGRWKYPSPEKNTKGGDMMEN